MLHAVVKCKDIKFAAAVTFARLHALSNHARSSAAADANLAAARRAYAAAISAVQFAFVEALPSLQRCWWLLYLWRQCQIAQHSKYCSMMHALKVNVVCISVAFMSSCGSIVCG